jgi:putative sigma-54 modulation protein
MRLELTGRHVEITPALRRLIDGKLAKLERLLNDSALSAQTVLTRERGRHRVDITLHARGEKFMHGFGYATSWELAVGGAIDKIAQQAQRVKGKWQAGKRRTIRTLAAIDQPEAVGVKRVPAAPQARAQRRPQPRLPRIVRTDRRPIKPMTLADAARELDSASEGVVVFRDRETEAISVLYRRRGELTLVKTEA